MRKAGPVFSDARRRRRARMVSVSSTLARRSEPVSPVIPSVLDRPGPHTLDLR
jgi:hypothetical protein